MDFDQLALQILSDHGISDQGVEGLASLLSTAWLQTIPEQQLLCREGDAASEMWVLVEGSVTVTKKDFLGVPQLLAEIEAPAILGHMALTDDTRRSAGISAGDAGASLVTIERGRFDTLLRSPDPAAYTFRMLLIAALSRQLARGRKSIREVLRDSRSLDEQSLTEMAANFEGWRQ